MWLLGRRDIRLLFRYSSWLFVENKAPSLPSDLSLLSFLSCWPFILHSPGSQTASFFIPTSPFVDTSGSCPLLFLSNKLIRIPYSKPTTWFIEGKSAFALHCVSETDLEDDIINELLYLDYCLAKSVENGKELLVLRGFTCFSNSHFSLIVCLFSLLLYGVCQFQFFRLMRVSFEKDSLLQTNFTKKHPQQNRGGIHVWKEGGRARHGKCGKPWEYCPSNFSDSRGSRLCIIQIIKNNEKINSSMV